MNLLQKVAKLSQAQKRFSGDYHSAFLSILDRIDLPETTVDGEDEDEEPEYQELDFENFGFSEVTTDKIEFSAGGDWQNPLKITLKYNVEKDEIYVDTCEPGFDDDYKIDFNRIMASINVSETPPLKGDPADAQKAWFARKKEMREKAITIFELTKGFTTESTDSAIKSMLEMAGYVMELTNDL